MGTKVDTKIVETFILHSKEFYFSLNEASTENDQQSMQRMLQNANNFLTSMTEFRRTHLKHLQSTGCAVAYAETENQLKGTVAKLADLSRPGLTPKRQLIFGSLAKANSELCKATMMSLNDLHRKYSKQNFQATTDCLKQLTQGIVNLEQKIRKEELDVATKSNSEVEPKTET